MLSVPVHTLQLCCAVPSPRSAPSQAFNRSWQLGRSRQPGDANLDNSAIFGGLSWDSIADLRGKEGERESKVRGSGAETLRWLGDPPALSDGVGGDVHTEDDVMHAPEIPTFGGTISVEDAEAMLSYLAVPALRVPLMLRFFSDSGRLTALFNPKLRRILWARGTAAAHNTHRISAAPAAGCWRV